MTTPAAVDLGGANRWLLLSQQALSGSVAYSSGIPTEGWAQAVVEVYCESMTLTGPCNIFIEFSNSDNGAGWMADPIEDTASATLATNEMLMPLRRFVRTWNENAGVAIPVPMAYKYMRVGVSGTDGDATVFVRRG